MTDLTAEAINTINGFRSDKIIMDFVTQEAHEKVASEINGALKGSTTAKAVELLAIRHANIADRVADYINAGLIGCYLVSKEN